MRSNDEIQKLIIDKAISDNRIRAVLLNGSRANNKIQPDKYQDFDIVYIVTELSSFISDHGWTAYFGEKLIFQLPNEMSFGNEKQSPSFTYLMLFKDGNRIDLTLFPVTRFKTEFTRDRLTIVWLDKDKMFSDIPPPDDKDYLIKKPTQQEFRDTCNEFWWVSTYVSKGLLRHEIVYAKDVFETIVRKMFFKIVEWYIGAETDFSISLGNRSKFIEKYLQPALYEKMLATYPDHQLENIWSSLFAMTELFSQLSLIVANRLSFQYNQEEEENVKLYLRQTFGEQ
jgi:aminoglycoside 6-adenylyltransferase